MPTPRPLNTALRYQTPPEWAKVALKDLDAFLLDHASCERKAMAVGMSFVVRYPDRKHLLDPIIMFAREELEHFHQVFRIIQSRGLQLASDYQDEYANTLIATVRIPRDERFLDRLLITSVIEARGHERFKLISEHVEDPELRDFYARLTKAEARHTDLFLEIAAKYFPHEVIQERLDFYLELEAKTIIATPFRSAIH